MNKHETAIINIVNGFSVSDKCNGRTYVPAFKTIGASTENRE